MQDIHTGIPFSQIIDDLLDDSKPFPPVHLHRFSDLFTNDLDLLKASWQKVNQKRKIALFEDLEELAEADPLMCFDDLSIFALEDQTPQVRAIAIRLLWETNDVTVPRRLIRLVKSDPDEVVRADAASGLGVYVYRGELGEISEATAHLVMDTLLAAYRGNDTQLVKRKCLESLGFSSNQPIPSLIRKAYDSADMTWRVSALFAMGRSADARWRKQVTASLNDPDPEIRYEAIRAAGELEMKDARQTLLEFLLDEENRENEDMFRAIVWSLSQIGGDNVRATLSELIDLADEDEAVDFIEDALDNLSLTEGLQPFDILAIPLDDEDGDDPRAVNEDLDLEDDEF